MALQNYYIQPSPYHLQAVGWLKSPRPAGGTNFDFLMANAGKVLTWQTGQWNNSANYLGPNNQLQWLILGPIPSGILGNLAGGTFPIGGGHFFYVDPNLPPNQLPPYNQNTPFIIRGMATALRDCLTQGGALYSGNRTYRVAYDHHNHVLEIERV